MTPFFTLPVVLALAFTPIQPDTVRYSYTLQDPIKVDIKSPVVIIDGEIQPEGFEWNRDIAPKTISRMNIFMDSLTCATYGGKRATEEGLVYIITRKNADKFEMPKAPKDARPAKGTKFEALYDYRKKDPWSVECNGPLEELPSFENGKPDAFFRWLNRTVIMGGKDYMGDNITRDDCGPTEVSFVVTAEGQVKDVKVLHKRTERFNTAVSALVADSPAWKPARKNGRAVPVVVIYPVQCFILIQ